MIIVHRYPSVANLSKFAVDKLTKHEYIRIIMNNYYSRGIIMSRTVTLRLDDEIYKIIKQHANADNRPLSNYIETATLKYIENIDFVDDYEMDHILNDKELLDSLRRGNTDAKNRNGRFV